MAFANLHTHTLFSDASLDPEELVRQVYQEGVARYRHTFDNTRIVIEKIQETIAANNKALAQLDEILNKAQIAVQALAEVLVTDYNPLSNQGSEMITARQKILAAMINVQQSKETMTISIEQLNGALRQFSHFLPKAEMSNR